MLKLKREVGLFGAVIYILGVIIGAGIYVIIGEAAGIAGNSLWLSFLIAALIAGCTGLSYAELSSTFPYDAAEYVYTERAFKDKRFSFGIGWMKLVTHIVSIAAVALGFGGYLSRLTGWNFVFCAVLLLFVLTLINLFGLKQAMGLDMVLVLVAMLGLLLLIGFGISSVHAPEFYMPTVGSSSGIITAAALVFFAFLGFENLGNLGEEVRDPKKTLPRALIISVIVSVGLYMLVAVIAVSVVPWEQLGNSSAPLSDVMAALLGHKAGWLMAIMALGATGSTVLGLLIGTSRIIYGMAEEHTIPSIFGKVSRIRRVPYIAIIVTSLICMLCVLPGDITSVAFLTDFGALFIFMIVNLCLIVLRYSHDNIPRGFRIPLNIGKFPIIPAFGLIFCVVLLFSFSKKVFFWGIIMFLSGILIYTIFGEREQRKAAKLFVENALDKEKYAKKRSVKKKELLIKSKKTLMSKKKK